MGSLTPGDMWGYQPSLPPGNVWRCESRVDLVVEDDPRPQDQQLESPAPENEVENDFRVEQE
eukprot:4583168-Prorocentrum_lima.AAC.1